MSSNATIIEELIPTTMVDKACPACGKWRKVPAAVGFPICKPCDAKWGGFPDIDERLKIMTSGLPFLEVIKRRSHKHHEPVDERLHVPRIFLKAQANDSLLEWSGTAAKPLVLSGPTGRGKSYQAAGVMRAYLEHNTGHGYMINCSSLHRMAKEEFSLYVKCAIITLDDMGAKLTPASISGLYEIIDTRLGNLMPTIVTTNMDIMELAAVDQRITSRLSAAEWVGITGKDRRLGE